MSIAYHPSSCLWHVTIDLIYSTPIINTEAPMMKARKTFPILAATNSMRSAREPANTVPSPLFSPLHMVAPVDQ